MSIPHNRHSSGARLCAAARVCLVLFASVGAGLGSGVAPAAAQTTEGLGARTDVSGLTDPRGIAIRDVNGDSWPDLVVSDSLAGTVAVFRGRGDGTFQAPLQTPAGQNPQAIAFGDINGDGKPDAAVANVGHDMVSVLPGLGDGTFDSSIIVPLSASPRGLAVADVNHDGRADLIVTLPAEGGIGVWLGNGNGTFQSVSSYPTAPGALAVAVADMDTDGHPDLVVANGSASSLTVLWNSGTGTFSSASPIPLSGPPVALAIGDFDGDGRRDLAAALTGSDVSVALNIGARMFLEAEDIATGVSLQALAAADVNGDASIDLVVAGTEGLAVLHGRGDGTFAAAIPYAGDNGIGIAVGDVNGDGRLDVAMTRGPGLVAFWLAQPVLAPVTTIGVTPVAPDGARGWYVSAPRVTVSATDGTGTGVAETRCVLDPVVVPATFDALPAGCAYTGAGAEITIDGEHRFYAASVDAAGNREPVRSVTIRLDRTPPIVVCRTPPPSFPYAAPLTPRVQATVSDDISGPWPVPAINTVVDITSFGEHTVSLTGSDTAGLLTTVLCPYTVTIRAVGDDDGDGMSNEDEINYGLDPRDRFGDNGADGDPDHDGIPNLREVSALPPSHPRGFYKQFLAEGAVGAFFQTTLGLLNASTDAPAHVLVTWLPEHSFSGGAVSRAFTLEPLQRRSFDLGVDLSAAMSGGVSTTIESDQPIGAMRDMRWGDPIYGSTLERAAPAAARTWYFAEGATGAFNEYLLLANPTDDLVDVQIEYLRPTGAPILQQVRVPRFSRLTVPVNDVPGLAATEVAAIVTSPVPIVAERATYVSFSDRLFDAGTAGLGATTLSSSWHFAEGATGFFSTFLLLANPGDLDARVTMTYALADGTTITTSHDVAAHSRKTVDASGEDPALAAAAFSTAVSSTQPIATERAMWWGRPWYEGDVSQGSTETGTVWAVGEGAEGGAADESTFLLVSNAAADPGRVRVTVVFDSGDTVPREYPLIASARQTIRILDDFPMAADRRFSVLVESLPDDPAAAVPLTVEVARYQSASGRFGEGGGAALATRIR